MHIPIHDGVHVIEHAWEKEKSMMASGSHIHAPAVVVLHETFESLNKRFLSHEIFIIIILKNHHIKAQDMDLGAVHGK